MSRNGDVPLEYQTAVASYMSFLSLNSSKDQPRFDTVEAASVNAAVCTEGADNAPLGDKFSSAGPAPFKGDILDDPDLLWTEDVWSEEKVLEAQERLKSQGDNLSSFWRKRYESKAGTYWHEFYKRNENHFYKDRHYLHIVFPELLTNSTMPICDSNTYRLLEVGCGVGNAVIPLVDLNPNMQVVAIDFARSAIQILNEHPKVLDGRIAASVCNIVEDILPVSEGSMDGILCMFVLSAVAPAEHRSALTKLYNALKPGGKLFFRDYGRYISTVYYYAPDNQRCGLGLMKLSCGSRKDRN